MTVRNDVVRKFARLTRPDMFRTFQEGQPKPPSHDRNYSHGPMPRLAQPRHAMPDPAQPCPTMPCPTTASHASISLQYLEDAKYVR